jgi:antitoxin YefM
MKMRVMRVSKAQKIFERLVECVNKYDDPLLIEGGSSNAVLVSEKYWRAVNETVYLMAIPGISESIKKARRQVLAKSKKTLNF